MRVPLAFRVALTGLLCLPVLSARADAPMAPMSPTAVTDPRPDAATVAAWADDLFGPALAARRFSGAEIVVVKDGEVLVARGYGLADPATGRAMDPATTEVRIGSTTKSVTATAIAQLLEQGRIASLDDDANIYLKRVQLPSWQGREITVRDLLTHRAGFEDFAFSLGTDRVVAHPVDADLIRRYMPDLVRPPGATIVYSNFGTAVLGLIVEDVSGQPIDAYFKAHIFDPLGMADSRLDLRMQPSERMAIPYAALPNGDWQKIGFIPMHPFIAPAGGITTTGLDMARFMNAHIAGEGGKAGILTPEGFRRMHARDATNHPAVSGVGMVFLESLWNGAHVVEHGGGWPGFQTVMLMVPERGMGVFASIVGEGPVVGLEEQLATLVTRTRLTPDPKVTTQPVLSSSVVREEALALLLGAYRPVAGAEGPAASLFAGSYCRQRRSHSTIEAVFDFFNAGYGVHKVAAGADGTLTIRGVAGYRQVAPGVFWNPAATPARQGDPDVSAVYAFTIADGRAVALAPQLSVDSWERCGDVWNPATAGLGLPPALLLFLGGAWCLFWRTGRSRAERAARVMPVALLATMVALPFALLGFYGPDDGLMYHLLEGRPARFVTTILIANLAGMLALGIIAASVLAWRGDWWGQGRGGLVRRGFYSLIAVASLYLLAFLGTFNLLGVHLP
ncbi:serine hydrolase domain-containing protein [Niveispirillum fermenti]|uniref:serine hydrolase domain-containing protein n=1 Tax=Niveispirillum fermenti TaxID=1233113 RepID=UPI003A8AA007